MTATGCGALGIDWMTDIEKARLRVGDKVALQGNMDPSILYASKECIELEVKKILKQFGQYGSGHVFNLGHGIHQDIPPDHVKNFINSVHKLSEQYQK